MSDSELGAYGLLIIAALYFSRSYVPVAVRIGVGFTALAWLTFLTPEWFLNLGGPPVPLMMLPAWAFAIVYQWWIR